MTQRGQAVPNAEITPPAVQSITIILPGFPVVANDVCMNWFRVNQDFTLSGASFFIAAKTAPSGSAVIFDIQRSQNFGASFASIFPSGLGNKLTFPAGSSHATATITLAITTLTAGDVLRVDILQVDSGGQAANITIDIVPAP